MSYQEEPDYVKTFILPLSASVGRLLQFVSEASNIKTVISVGHVTDTEVLEKLRSCNIQVILGNDIQYKAVSF